MAALSDSVVLLLLAGAGEARVNHGCLTEIRYLIDSFLRLIGKRWSVIWFEGMPAWGKTQDLTLATVPGRPPPTAVNHWAASARALPRAQASAAR